MAVVFCICVSGNLYMLAGWFTEYQIQERDLHPSLSISTEEGKVLQFFWYASDFGDILTRWRQALPRENIIGWRQAPPLRDEILFAKGCIEGYV